MTKEVSPEQEKRIVRFVLDNLGIFRQLVLLAGPENYSTRKSPRDTISREEASRLMLRRIRK